MFEDCTAVLYASELNMPLDRCLQTSSPEGHLCILDSGHLGMHVCGSGCSVQWDDWLSDYRQRKEG